MLQIARMGGWVFDALTGKVQWTSEIYDLFELPYNTELTIDHIKPFFSPGSQEQRSTLLATATSRSEAYDVTLGMVTARTGRHLLIRILGQPELEDGRVVRVFGTLQDVTPRDNAQKADLEQELDETQMIYRLATAGSSAGIWHWINVNESGEWWSDNFFRLLGYEPWEIEASLETFRELLHPDDHAATFARLEAHFQSRASFRVEYRLRTRSGRYKWFLGSGQAEWDAEGRPVRMVGSIVDIDAHKQAQLALERFHLYQERLNRLSFDMSLQREEFLSQGSEILRAYYDLPSSGITRVQGGVLEVMAIEDAPARARGRIVAAGDKFPLAGSLIAVIYDQEGVLTLDELAAANPERHAVISSYGVETMIASPFWVQGEPYGVVNCHGYVPRPEGFNSYEHEFMQLFCRWLGFMLERRYYIEHLHKLNASKDRLLAVIAHDLRNPLAAIVSATRRLERKQELDPRMLSVIDHSCEHATQLITDLLAAAELEQDELKLPLEPIDLGRFVQEALQRFEPLAAAKQLRLSWEPAAGALVVALNPRKMLRVLENLLHNALKFTPAGGEARLRLRREGQEAWLTIEDTGIGIPLELQAVLFDKYSAARRQGLRGEHSNGLGMYIVHEIVQLHSGRIRVFSEVQQGTCFRLELPLVHET
ncbi:MAG: ATP-binding protein [Candidatus Sericytochromatia bacterium]